jgi:ATP-dependent DNA helicase DinG
VSTCPTNVGLPARFKYWRPGQQLAIDRALNSPARFMAMCMPTGSGKSLVYVALSRAFGRTCILTSTKGLQDQLIRDFREIGMTDIRGMNNYECLAVGQEGEFPFFKDDSQPVACDEGPCTGGFRCEMRQAGCTYFDAKRTATRSELVVTNYSYWLRVMNTGKEDAGLGKFDLLVLDEAHGAPDELSDYLSVEVGAAELEQLISEGWPGEHPEFDWWRSWAERISSVVGGQIAEAEEDRQPTRAALRHLKALRSLRDRLGQVKDAKGEWVQESYRDMRGSRKLKFDPVYPKEYNGALFADVPHVLMVSATVRPKTLDLLGLGPSGAGGQRLHDFMESNVAFPVARRPVIYVPTVRMKHGMDNGDMIWWVNRIDQIIDKRKDRKGILHTTSYKRAEFFMAHTRHGEICALPRGPAVRGAVAAFKGEAPDESAGHPAQLSYVRLLVSPSLTTGYDFPGDSCRYQIVGKIPFPDTRSKVLQAREAHDKDYGAYVAMQTLVQTCGRGMRSADDWCETIIVDSNWSWFLPRYKHFAPDWFIKACSTSNLVPDALNL